MEKEYTKIRRFYAWVGFAVVLIASSVLIVVLIEVAKYYLLGL